MDAIPELRNTRTEANHSMAASLLTLTTPISQYQRDDMPYRHRSYRHDKLLGSLPQALYTE